MIEYVISQSPDDRVIQKACDLLNKDGIVVIPTDTNWVMTASFDSKKAIDRLYRIKGESKHHHFSLLCSDLSMASDVAIINDTSFRFIKKHIPGSFTFILEAQHRVTKLLQASKTDKEIGLRFPPGVLARKLISSFEKPLVSTNISPKLLGLSDDILPYGYLIDEQLAHVVDLIIDPGEVDFLGQSTVVSMTNDSIEVIRQGVGIL